MVQLENANGVYQVLRLSLETGGCSRDFFDQRGILLGDLVHLYDGFADLVDASALLPAGGTDFAHDLGHPANAADHFPHGGSSPVRKLFAHFDTRDAGVDEILDFLGRLGASHGQAAHLSSHYRETTALLTRAGCLHRSIQREDVGLECNAIDDVDDVGDLARAR